ncbi:MAG: nuclear transport factor 2 family protein [Alphaproteobacteria bacterium]|nr:nuclear transport factor 2 family protein [Alphaproteobacteria bacterium]MBU1515902.1 nuclear transport factor 2 family protein [Alphaproteobacteria bacterium]MBU2094124.1 nuclear transport factor 2 family protein [Alphaproteobacteria bacterium]MBU2151476.1 nuclear transport factor 2 family protein [Alphaproteobacteria bacterium]MBU2305248.1 nuclear transport factor 2 family protein [Alphaproteobacteria bacterium]
MRNGWMSRGAGVALVLALSAGAAMAQDFDATLAKHFAAVSGRDLPALESTLTPGAELTLILPNATRTTTRQAFIDFHKDFFADKTWTMRFEPVAKTVTGDMAVVSVRTRWDGQDEGKPVWSESWLTLVFRKDAGRWGLIHDQNTRIRTGP